MLIKVVKRKIFTHSRPPVMLYSVMRVLMFMVRAAGARPRSHYNAGRSVAVCRSWLNHQPAMPPTAQPTRLPKIGTTVPRTAPPTQPPVTARLVVQPRPAPRHRTARVVVAPGPGAGRPPHEHQYSHNR